MILKEMYKDIVWFVKIVGTLVLGAKNSLAVPGHYIVKKQEQEQVQALKNKTEELKKQTCMHPELGNTCKRLQHVHININRNRS